MKLIKFARLSGHDIVELFNTVKSENLLQKSEVVVIEGKEEYL